MRKLLEATRLKVLELARRREIIDIHDLINMGCRTGELILSCGSPVVFGINFTGAIVVEFIVGVAVDITKVYPR